MSILSIKQKKFTYMVAQLIIYAYSLPGYQLTFGDAYRDPRVGYGHPNSLHRNRLAVDLNLFVNGEYINCDPEHEARHVALWEKIGAFWKCIGGSWGGDFNDYNHFSLEHDGMK